MEQDVPGGRGRYDIEAPDEHERAIIAAANATRRTSSGALPAPFATADLFFRFDPGFRRELKATRSDWRGSDRPVSDEGLTPEQRFSRDVALRQDRRLRDHAQRLARLWGLDPISTASALAYDTPPNYAYAKYEQDVVDVETGLRVTRLTVYTHHAWPAMRNAIQKVFPQTSLRVEPARFPEGSPIPARVRGLGTRVVARTMAIHFLWENATGGRPTGGRRSWEEAERLWREEAPDAPKREEGVWGERNWWRDRDDLLRDIASRRMEPVQRLEAARRAAGTTYEDWADLLGVPVREPDGRPSGDTWEGVLTGTPPTDRFWEAACRALPGLSGDRWLDGILEGGIRRDSVS